MIRALALAALLLGFCIAPTLAAPTPSRPLVVILLPGTSLTDWRAANAPMLHRIMATGSVAVMNTRTARLPNDHKRETQESAALTLGAGSRAAGGSEDTDFHPTQEQVLGSLITYGELYARHTGEVTPRDAGVNTQWPKVTRENSGQGYDLLPGNLGEGLSRHGIRVSVGGGWFASPVACDSNGTVNFVAGDGRFPFPLPRCLVWDIGSDLVSADALLRQIESEVAAQQGRLVIVSPFVNDQEYSRGARLAPIVVWGTDVPPGLLYSPSTHRAGLVTNTDFAPSVTAYFGATARRPWLPSTAFGHPWEFRAKTDAAASVARLETQAYRQARGMRVLPWAAICLGLLVIGQIVLFRREIPCRPLLWLPGVVIFALLVSPSMVVAGLCLAVLSLIFWRLQTRLGAAGLVSLSAALMVLILIGDTLLGSRLMRNGLLGYSVVEGARYYGIGNESMGVLIGSALVAADALWKRHRNSRSGVVIGLFGLALLLGLPSAGAKAGGLLVAVAAFGTFVWTAWGRRWNVRVVLCVIIGMVLTLAVASLLDWRHHTGVQTHFGGAVERIRLGGVGEALDIVRRKLAVESRLLYHSAWAVPLWACLLGLFCRAKRFSNDTNTPTKALLYGGTAALMVCLAVNDAGVVAAALCGTLILCGQHALPTEKRPPSDSSAV